MLKSFKLGSKTLGPNEQTYFIADIAANHDRSLDRAKKLIELAKEAGADAAKFQNFQASKIVSKHGFEQMGSQIAHQSKWKKSVYEVYEDASISKDWTAELKKHCDQVGITYFTSPYDVESVDHVDQYLPAYKIGSGDITFVQLLEYIAKKGKPLFLATGASTLEDVTRAIDVLSKSSQPGTPICLMQCNTNYTGSLENFEHIQLNVLRSYSVLFPDVLLGLSDHTPGHATVLGAVALGARVVEKHFTDDNGRAGPDHPFSMNPKSWKNMVERTHELELALGGPLKKIERNEVESAIVQRRGVYAACALKKGDKMQASHVEALRPAPIGAVLPFQISQLEGLRAPKNYESGDLISWNDWRSE